MSRSDKIIQRVDGDSWEIDTSGIQRWFCCDCGLAHDMEFKVKSKNKIVVTISTNGRATGSRRRYKDFKCTPKF